MKQQSSTPSTPPQTAPGFCFLRNVTPPPEEEALRKRQSSELELLCLDYGDQSTQISSSSSASSLSSVAELQLKQEKAIDVEQYMSKREMTPTQERWNALTMIPSPLYCLYFLMAGCWMDTNTLLQEANSTTFATTTQAGCLPFTNMPALPPLPVLAVAFGIIVHAPFSFLYHWTFAHSLPAGASRTNHWSRRLDQSMIHVASASMSYATTGSWAFFLANVLYNVDCIYRQWQPRVHPQRNQTRIALSILAYTSPILIANVPQFLLFWVIMGVAGWLFVQYPIGGWSHAAFHLVVAFIVPVLFVSAMQLPASYEALKLAAECAAAV